jgi:hypothetical protein
MIITILQNKFNLTIISIVTILITSTTNNA